MIITLTRYVNIYIFLWVLFLHNVLIMLQICAPTKVSIHEYIITILSPWDEWTKPICWQWDGLTIVIMYIEEYLYGLDIKALMTLYMCLFISSAVPSGSGAFRMPTRPASAAASTFKGGKGQSQKRFSNFFSFLAWGFFGMTLTTYHKKDLVESL